MEGLVAQAIQRLRVVIRGAVQGVGFRPFVYRLATEMALPGWVINSAQGVFIEVEGTKEQLDTFLLRVEHERPPRSFIQSLEASFLDPLGFTAFEIRHSQDEGAKSVLVLPDLATCPDCLHDIRDPANRRYQYAFTNCTNCGPRYSIIEALPYDRPNTSMRGFVMCDECRAEYENPLDRRFHAQPIACPRCGPQLELWDENGRVLAQHHDALLQVADSLRRGRIAAVKGIGGFHLMADARNDDAVRLLRQRKHREEKPFALMFPSLEQVRVHCAVSPLEERLLLSPESPIVLLQRLTSSSLHLFSSSPPHPLSLALAPPPNPALGVMLPYTPLHHLLLAELGFPVVATSGNLSDEPICIDEHEALERLRGIADVFLVHNRPIVRHVDDSIVRVVLGREMVLRRARGYAPLPIPLPQTTEGSSSKIPNQKSKILAVGAHLKNSIAITVGDNAFISQHIGDLETPQAFDAFQRVIADLSRLYEFEPSAIACDMHPDYMSTHYARDAAAATQPPLPVVPIQHHYAHIVACMAENEIANESVLGVSWDGTGYGLDGSIWGGEFLLVQPPLTPNSFTRVAHLHTFRLPGGDRAVKEPRRTALGLLYELWGDAAMTRSDLAPVMTLSGAERSIIRQMLRQKLNAPLTSSAGRLFDAVAALIGLRQYVNYEGQAAMELEFAAQTTHTDAAFPFDLKEERLEIRELEIGDLRIQRGASPIEDSNSPISNLQSPSSKILNPKGTVSLKSKIVVDWSPTIEALLADVKAGVDTATMAATFHNTLSEMIVAVSTRVGQRRVVLSGGVFQNRLLLERTVQRLQAEGFQPYWHQRVPPNDGGIALGQAVAASCVRP
jgi:hydrogenase maturation protein HypF